METSAAVSNDSGPKRPKSLRELTKDELREGLGWATANTVYNVNDYLTELRSRDATDTARRTFWTAVASSVAAFFSAIAAMVALWLSLTHQQPPPGAGSAPSSSVPPSASSVAPASPTSPATTSKAP
ncbi:MAG: hypothetical protein JWR34_7429 [Mycobacterium sp.]|nr:hypothetical protein [Mycobacterium sp.]